MSGPSGHGGLASSDRDNMIRNPAANVQTTSTAGSVCNWLPWRENQLVKLIRRTTEIITSLAHSAGFTLTITAHDNCAMAHVNCA